jgi:hypothetical protein
MRAAARISCIPGRAFRWAEAARPAREERITLRALSGITGHETHCTISQPASGERKPRPDGGWISNIPYHAPVNQKAKMALKPCRRANEKTLSPNSWDIWNHKKWDDRSIRPYVRRLKRLAVRPTACPNRGLRRVGRRRGDIANRADHVGKLVERLGKTGQALSDDKFTLYCAVQDFGKPPRRSVAEPNGSQRVINPVRE